MDSGNTGEENKTVEQVTQKEKYEYLISAKNLHYDNFNKWLTYFYVVIGALFVGYCSVISSDRKERQILDLLEWGIPIIAFTVSLFWYWSAKGYYYWHVNFISLLLYYEKDILKFPEDQRVYYVFANKNLQNNYYSPIQGANISTSKIAILLAFLITTFWAAVFLCRSFAFIGMPTVWLFPICFIFSIGLITIATKIVPNKFLRSNNNSFPDLGIIYSKD